jgi:3-methyladenine DNA glycosylase AlkD
MNTQEARTLGANITKLIQEDSPDKAYKLLTPVLAARTPFRLLDIIGEAISHVAIDVTDPFLQRVAAAGTEGGWVVIASAWRQQMEQDRAGIFERCHECVIAANIWYAADIFGERIVGPSLVSQFQPTLDLLEKWRSDPNRWIRRTVGVATHFWSKRSRGAPELAGNAQQLLDFLDPMFEEWNMDAVKGVGWGLKTLGRHYPEHLTPWLAKQVGQRKRRHRAIMLHKASTYLNDAQRARAQGLSES